MLAHEDLTAPNKGTSFAHSAGHGRLFAKTETPCPGAYAAITPLDFYKRKVRQTCSAASESPRFGTLIFREAMRKAIPGPGSYDDYSNYRKSKGFDMALTTSRLYQASNPFSANNCESHPGPGSYEIDRKMNLRWSPTVTRKCTNNEFFEDTRPSFLSSEKRFYEIVEEKKSPGPGRYTIERKLDSSSVKYVTSAPRTTDFGIVRDTPGPAAYNTATDIIPRSPGSPDDRDDGKSESIKARKNMIIHIFSKSPRPPAPFTSRADRFELPPGAGAPGPSAYDTVAASQAKNSYGKIGSRCKKIKAQNHPTFTSSKPLSFGVSDYDARVNFAPSEEAEFLRLPTSPGPADYELNDAPLHTRGPHTVVGGAPRLVGPDNKNPAPNTYNARKELLRKTFNKTLGAKITNPYKSL